VRKELLYLRDILSSCDRIASYTAGGKEAFFASTMQQDAVIRNFEIIGEAIKQVSASTTTGLPDIPWRSVARFRDLLIHHYFAVDLNIVWGIVEPDLTDLRQQIREVLRQVDPEFEGP
jgi:uncharacterized protein with HEPN domain